MNSQQTPAFNDRFIGGEESLVPGGYDRRTKVTDTTQYPFNSICYISMYQDEPKRDTDNQGGHGTGFLIGTKTVLTCAHNCFYKGSRKLKLLNSVSFYDQQKQMVFDKRINCDSLYLKKYSELDQKDDFQFDYAVLKLREPARKNADQCIGLDFTQNLSSQKIIIPGFPEEVLEPGVKVEYDGRKKLLKSKKNIQRFMYQHQGNYNIEEAQNKVLYKIDSTLGQSGSPMLSLDEDQQIYYTIGVHTQGFIVSKSDRDNFGVKLSKRNIDNITRWFLQSQTGKEVDKNFSTQKVIEQLRAMGYKIKY